MLGEELSKHAQVFFSSTAPRVVVHAVFKQLEFFVLRFDGSGVQILHVDGGNDFVLKRAKQRAENCEAQPKRRVAGGKERGLCAREEVRTHVMLNSSADIGDSA